MQSKKYSSKEKELNNLIGSEQSSKLKGSRLTTVRKIIEADPWLRHKKGSQSFSVSAANGRKVSQRQLSISPLDNYIDEWFIYILLCNQFLSWIITFNNSPYVCIVSKLVCSIYTSFSLYIIFCLHSINSCWSFYTSCYFSLFTSRFLIFLPSSLKFY